MVIWTHNAYWFQGAPSLWREERQEPHPEALKALIDLYRSLDADVLCLQEVPTEQVAQQVGDDLGMSVTFAAGGERTMYGGAILWREGLAAQVQDLSQMPTSLGCRFERICMVMTLNVDDSSVDICNVHLSSNRFAPQSNGEPVRLAELETLFAQIEAPSIIAGDFNARPDSTVYEMMRSRGYEDPHTGMVQEIDYLWQHGDTRIHTEPLLLPADFEIPGHAGVALSDHRPVGTRVTVPSFPGK